MPKSVLIVDDDPTQRRLVRAVVEREGYGALQAESGEKALELLANPTAKVDVVLLDLVMPGLGGLETLKELAKSRAETPVIVLTASGGIETVVEAMRAGARDFFVKPASPERILVSIRNAFKVGELEGEVKRLKKTTGNTFTFTDMIATAPAMRPVVKLGQRAAQSNIPVLITGESGVGKEVIARAVHGESERAGRPFITVNCGAIPENLVESILFGHEKGAFTGATERHLGKFREADGGTIFLDEIGELPLDMQVKLLRVLQESEVDPVGGKRPVKVDVRILSATNRDLAGQVELGRFREDLFYRLNVFPIEAPPLRERREDVPALVDHFVARFNAQEGRRLQGASPATLEALANHDWPGNVRQLENAVFRAVILADGERLEPWDFPQITGQSAPATPTAVRAPTPSAVPTPAPRPTPTDAPSAEQPLIDTPVEGAEDAASDDAHPKPVEIFDPQGHLRSLESIERDLIQFAIEVYSGHMSEVARRLGIGRSTLYRKVREHDLDVEGLRAS